MHSRTWLRCNALCDPPPARPSFCLRSVLWMETNRVICYSWMEPSLDSLGACMSTVFVRSFIKCVADSFANTGELCVSFLLFGFAPFQKYVMHTLWNCILTAAICYCIYATSCTFHGKYWRNNMDVSYWILNAWWIESFTLELKLSNSFSWEGLEYILF